MGLFKSLKGSPPSSITNSFPQPSTSQPHSTDTKSSYAPPSYAPPSYAPPSSPDHPSTANPPPYHNWESIPDTSLLPPPPPPPAPPPPSSTHNASFSAAAAGHAFCASNPPFTPSLPTPKIQAASLAGRVGLQPALEFRGHVELKATGGAKYGEIWHAEASSRCPDANLMSVLPMFFAEGADPRSQLTRTEPTTIYYEVRVLRMRGPEAVIAVGFAAKPYPGWRLPGWHRGSVGVHGDDGRRFVNDSEGGIDFVGPWREGNTVGIGMRFCGGGSVEVFFTRDGTLEGRWWVDEERDAERDGGGVEGLLGEGDLYLCVGCCGGVEFEVVVERRAWLYRGDGS